MVSCQYFARVHLCSLSCACIVEGRGQIADPVIFLLVLLPAVSDALMVSICIRILKYKPQHQILILKGYNSRKFSFIHLIFPQIKCLDGHLWRMLMPSCKRQRLHSCGAVNGSCIPSQSASLPLIPLLFQELAPHRPFDCFITNSFAARYAIYLFCNALTHTAVGSISARLGEIQG